MINYIKKILYIISESRKNLVLILCSFIFVSVLEVFGIGAIGPFIGLASNPDIIEEHQTLNWLYRFSTIQDKYLFVALAGFLVILVFCLKSFLSWRIQTQVFVFSFREEAQLRTKLMNGYLLAPYTFHLNTSSTHIIINMLGETKKFASQVLIPLLTSLANLIITIFLVVLLSFVSPFTVIAVMVMILPLFLLVNSFKHKIAHWGQVASQTNQEVVRIINHSLGSVKETRVIGCEAYFQQKLIGEAQKYAKSSGAFFAFRLSPRIIIETLLVTMIIGWVSVYLILGKNVQELTPILGVFAIASIRMIPAISNMTSAIGTLRNSDYTVQKIYSDLKELEDLGVRHSPSGIELDHNLHLEKNLDNYADDSKITFDREIAIEDITYSYPNAEETSIDRLCLTIKKGQSIALIGKSGAGKTTLVDIILGLIQPQQGEIKADGRSIYEDLRSWQNLIGYIPQSIFLMEDTIERNIAFGVPDCSIDRLKLRQAVKAAQLESLIAELPEGLQTMVGERGVRLSGGQRQRVGIARALYHEREILVLDEATAALDGETESLVTKAIESLSGSKTTITIAHRLSTIEHCDAIYVMEKGKIVRSGTYESVVLAAN